jgi:nitroimidazol reductase NimA-like FMN-containing flavoprotein (pyridoxamine 5'-phosphate oxidase superfamily)
VCITVTILDGLVLARSTFHHSMNYRSCVILGSAHAVTDMEEKRAALEAIVDHIVPGRSAEVGFQQPALTRKRANTSVHVWLYVNTSMNAGHAWM